jgi:dihydrofolate reductase
MLLLLQVYKEAVDSERCSVIHLTHVEAQPECDTFFPDITAEGARWSSGSQGWGTASGRRGRSGQ